MIIRIFRTGDTCTEPMIPCKNTKIYFQWNMLEHGWWMDGWITRSPAENLLKVPALFKHFPRTFSQMVLHHHLVCEFRNVQRWTGDREAHARGNHVKRRNLKYLLFVWEYSLSHSGSQKNTDTKASFRSVTMCVCCKTDVRWWHLKKKPKSVQVFVVNLGLCSSFSSAALIHPFIHVSSFSTNLFLPRAKWDEFEARDCMTPKFKVTDCVLGWWEDNCA